MMRLIDSRELQRLRRVRALGLASLAFPGAEHSRFAHAIGSAHVMHRYLERVRTLSDDLPAHERVSDDMAAVALSAALLHDVGHGPYSHTFEDIIPGGTTHESWTSKIILDPETEVNRILSEVDPTMPRLVEQLILGQCSIQHLAHAVSGTFDVDRCDYLMRDSHMTGVGYGHLDLDWLLASLRLYLPADESVAHLAVNGEKGLTAVEGFFLGRLYMYRQVYLHKAVRAAEVMLQTLFSQLQSHTVQLDASRGLTAMLTGQPLSTMQYLELDDLSLDNALIEVSQRSNSQYPELAQLASQLRSRQLFKTLPLRADLPRQVIQDRIHEVQSCSQDPAITWLSYDRVEVDAYVDDQALVVLGTDGRISPLVESSPVLHGLSREQFVHARAIFPAHLRHYVGHRLQDLT